jgi:hypothetical protein
MQIVRRIILAAMLLATGSGGLAQQTRPTTAPAADGTTPRGTLRLLNTAMSQGDVAAIKRLFIATTAAEVRMVEADAEMAAALADFRRAAAKAFGEDGAKVVTGDTGVGAAESIARINAADIAITGDTAIVTYPDQTESPFVLKKVAGRWRVPVSQLGKPLEKAALDQRLADLAVQRDVLRELTDRITKGKFADADQAREAWQTRILQAATSQPTTKVSEHPKTGE